MGHDEKRLPRVFRFVICCFICVCKLFNLFPSRHTLGSALAELFVSSCAFIYDKEAPYRLKLICGGGGYYSCCRGLIRPWWVCYLHPLFPGGWLAVAASRGAVTLDSSWDWPIRDRGSLSWAPLLACLPEYADTEEERRLQVWMEARTPKLQDHVGNEWIVPEPMDAAWVLWDSRGP
jgi:hypothetical protein